MIRVLHVLGGLGTGGTESLIMNWYRHIDRSKVQFDFLVRSSDDNYAEEITAFGGRIFYTASFPRHFVKNKKETEEVLKRKEWDVIHVHGNAAMYMFPLKLSKHLGYNCRIMHSHNVQAQNSMFSFIHKFNKMKVSVYATNCFACSEAAGKWMFDYNHCQLVRNAVDFTEFKFDSDARHEIRKAYGIDEKYVVGHVGRFASQKNHFYLLDLFQEFLSKRPDSTLMLVGDGELEEEIKTKAAQMGVLDSILFMGRRSDVGRLMSAMDVLVLPSLYEGLGIVLVEAQFSGLPCIVSEEAYNEEVQITSNLSKISLQDGAAVWADRMQQISQLKFERHIDADFAERSGYDMKTEVAKLEEFYLQAAKGNTY